MREVSGMETPRHSPLWGLREGGGSENQKITGQNSTSSAADNSAGAAVLVTAIKAYGEVDL
jgi:hypothetical protein